MVEMSRAVEAAEDISDVVEDWTCVEESEEVEAMFAQEREDELNMDKILEHQIPRRAAGNDPEVMQLVDSDDEDGDRKPAAVTEPTKEMIDNLDEKMQDVISTLQSFGPEYSKSVTCIADGCYSFKKIFSAKQSEKKREALESAGSRQLSMGAFVTVAKKARKR